MAQAILFPDPVSISRAWLVPRLGGVAVVQHRPDNAPVELVQLVRTGGSRAHLVVDEAQLTVTCWAKTDIRSAELAALARAHLGAMDGTSGVYGVRDVGAPYSNPDPESGSPRHTFTVAVNVRGAAIP